MKTFNGSMTFADGRTSTFTNHHAENEREMIKRLVDDSFHTNEKIVSITVLEKKDGVYEIQTNQKEHLEWIDKKLKENPDDLKLKLEKKKLVYEILGVDSIDI